MISSTGSDATLTENGAAVNWDSTVRVRACKAQKGTAHVFRTATLAHNDSMCDEAISIKTFNPSELENHQLK